MINGVGIDLVSIPRIKRLAERFPEKFPQRIFSALELELLSNQAISPATLAGRFAAKEAVLKAIGCGIGPAGLAEVEIVATGGRAPEVQLRGTARLLATGKGITTIALSISHEPPFACAVAAAF